MGTSGLNRAFPEHFPTDSGAASTSPNTRRSESLAHARHAQAWPHAPVHLPGADHEDRACSLSRSARACGYLVGLVEWVCIQAINPHIDWPREQTVARATRSAKRTATIVFLIARPPARSADVSRELVKSVFHLWTVVLRTYPAYLLESKASSVFLPCQQSKLRQRWMRRFAPRTETNWTRGAQSARVAD